MICLGYIENITFYLLVLIIGVYMILNSTILKRYKDKLIKINFDIISVILIYLFFSLYLYSLKNDKFDIISIIYFIMFIFIVIISIIAIIKTNKRKYNKNTIAVILYILTLIISSFALINIIVYLYIPNAYSGVDSRNIFTIAFDFIYNSFTISTTLSGSNIQTELIISKFLSMIQVIIFYYIIGGIVINIINNKTNSKKQDSIDDK
jgi:hypothetical protein